MKSQTNIIKTLQRLSLERKLRNALALTNPSQFDKFDSHLNESDIFELASIVPPTIELRLYPGWYFGIAETDPQDKHVMLRMAIWQYCKRHKLQQPVILPWYNNLRVHAYLGNDISRLLFIDGYYEPNEFVFLASILKPEMVFLDIGANDGLYSLFASKYVAEKGRVIAFEPSRREFSRLQANIALNNIPNITPYQLALYNTNGSKTFQIAGYEHEGQNTLGEFVYKEVSTERMELITIRRLDDLVAEEHWDRIDVIKMDVEGAEYAVLEGAQNMLSKHKPVLLLELNDVALNMQGRSANETLEFLQGFGYSIYSFSDTTGKLMALSADAKPSSNIVASASTLPEFSI